MSIGRSPTQYMGVLAKQPPNLIFAERAPVTGTDIAFRKGDIWLDSTNLATYQFAGDPAGTWIAMGSGATGGVVTLTGDSGGAIAAVAGNIDVLGTANELVTTGTAGTITLSLPAAIIAPGSLTTTTTLEAGTSIVAGTTITATLGDITATDGDLVLTAAGNKMIRTSVASTTTAGANSIGTVTLVGGTATIATTAITASSIIKTWRESVGATGAAATGNITVGTRTAGVSFVINAVDPADATALAATDVSVIGWEIVN